MVSVGIHKHNYHAYGPMAVPVPTHTQNPAQGFVLKPQVAQKALFGKNAGQLHWTETREQLPDALRQQGVPMDLWQDTFDNVVQIAQTKIDMQRCAMKMFCIPIVSCCVLPCIMAKKQTDLINEWDELVFSECKKYKPYGIKVTIARDFVTQGVGSHRHMAAVEVGLEFDIVRPAAVATPSHDYQQPRVTATAHKNLTPYVTAATGTPVSPGIASELRKLNDMYQQGILSESEFQDAKRRIIQGN